ncbi:transporter substrate-binding domain-containing protein [Aeromonas popoffii]|uniref:Transporter substrate-binding domain-containing protein n=1 Tax=Aeromonas popoffii TaxID=70856 RepID=A0ABS5GUD9_9GAMM|nr:transporter substrate-binding domain-containing protein [Aeromonas popoffii]MBR7630746.1 transporter substrate-binding domain-containing protein [Aeromonas popoffii]
MKSHTYTMTIFLSIFFIFPGNVYPSSEKPTTIILGVEDDWAPYCFLNKETGHLDGFTPIVVREAFKKVGIKTEYKVIPFSRCMYLALTDVISGCFNAAITRDNKNKYVWPKTPLVNEPLGVFSLTSKSRSYDASGQVGVYELLSGNRVGATLGYSYPTEILENSEITFEKVKSDSVQLDMLLRNRIDFALLGKGSGYYLASKKNIRDQVVDVFTISTDGDFYIAFSKATGNGEYLSTMFDKGMLELIKSGEYNELKSQLEQHLNMSTGDISGMQVDTNIMTK